MTEVEAKKILDFLAKRLSKQTSFQLIDSRIFKRNPYGDLVLEFTYGSYTYDDGCSEPFCRLTYLWTVEDNHTLQLRKEDTTINIIKFLFSKAKTKTIAIGMGGGYIPFINKGESLEEIKVKADLEEIS